MNHQTACSLLALGVTFALPSLASAQTLAEDFARLGYEVSVEQEAFRGGAEILSSARIETSEAHILADEISRGSDGLVTFRGLRIQDADRPRGPEITIEDLTLTSVEGLRFFENPEPCEPGAAFEDATYDWSFRNLSVREDNAAEGLTAAAGHISMQLGAQSACFTPRQISLSDAVFVGPDRSRVTFSSASQGLDWSTGEAIRSSLSIQDLVVLDGQTGLTSLINRVSVGFDLEGDLETLDIDSSADALRALLNTTSRLDVDISGVVAQLPETSPVQVVSGSISVKANHDKDEINLGFDLDFPEMMMASFALGLNFIPEGTAISLSSIAGDVPGIEILERLALRSFSFSASDLGVTDTFEAVSGMPPGMLLLAAQFAMADLPETVSAPVLGFLADILEGGAKVSAAPAQPVALAQVAMTGMLQPALLETILSIKRE